MQSLIGPISYTYFDVCGLGRAWEEVGVVYVYNQEKGVVEKCTCILMTFPHQLFSDLFKTTISIPTLNWTLSMQGLPDVTNHKLFASSINSGEEAAPRWI